MDEIVLIATVQKEFRDASIDTVRQAIRGLKERGLVEETVVKAPFDKAETFRFKITSPGIEFLQKMEEAGVVAGISPKEIESRLVETYDRIKADMEIMRQNLETSQKALEADMTGMRARIAEHDQVIRTYFVRVIETFGVFVGIFAVVVVMMISSLIGLTQMRDPIQILFIVVWVPVSLILMILAMLLGIKHLVLKAPRQD
ncbi:MAG: hypothetical protein LUQ32_00645 [Methanomicrobiales archaeon]|nr:hypothetical protein [Methanomicrobiales archaeon]